MQDTFLNYRTLENKIRKIFLNQKGFEKIFEKFYQTKKLIKIIEKHFQGATEKSSNKINFSNRKQF